MELLSAGGRGGRNTDFERQTTNLHVELRHIKFELPTVHGAEYLIVQGTNMQLEI